MNEEHYIKLKNSALRFTAYRERTPKEVIEKLEKWDTPQEIIDRILKELKADKFVDEERFARAFCHDKFLSNRWGKRRIQQELYKYDLPKPVQQQGLDYINQEAYESTLTHLAEQKWLKTKEKDLFKRKQKTVNFLMQKGYEPDLIWRVIGQLEDSKKFSYPKNGYL